MTNEERVRKFKNEKIAVNCQTEEEAKAFVDWCYDNGMEWFIDNREETFFKHHREQTAYAYGFHGNFLGYGRKVFFKEKNWEIITYQEFMKEEKKETTNFEYHYDELKELAKKDEISLDDYKELGVNFSGSPTSYAASVLRWLLDKPKKPIELSQFEYDLLNCCKDFHSGILLFRNVACLKELKDKGYFKNVEENMKINEILKRAKVIK